MYGLAALCYGPIQNIPNIKPFVALVTFFFLHLLIFFLSMYGLVALCYRLIQNISYTKQFVALVTFFSLPFLIFFQDLVLLQFVTEGYTKISI